MAYFDRLVANPEATLDEIAASRGDSRENLAVRLTKIREAAADGSHISLSQAQHFSEEATQRSPELDEHVQDCPYCLALINGLEKVAVDRTIKVAFERIQTGAAAQPLIIDGELTETHSAR